MLNRDIYASLSQCRRHQSQLGGYTYIPLIQRIHYFFNNRDGTPVAAYRWAKGFPVINTSNRTLIQIETPLDFLVVSDHAEYMTVPKRLFTHKDESLRETEFGKNR
ncbi:MAG: DUF3604 domain-containing protein [bacterium]|nr:DUF3604 domain-containing protein [Gammaproteobacteria bacterium]HIL98975.1 DUF3604 domain-containing protein [Pseudomonadales bacterium]